MNNKITKHETVEYVVNDKSFANENDAIEYKQECDLKDIYNETEKLRVSMGCVDDRDFAEFVMEYKNEILQALLPEQQEQPENKKDLYFEVFFDTEHVSINQTLIVVAKSYEEARCIANKTLYRNPANSEGDRFNGIVELTPENGVVYFDDGDY